MKISREQIRNIGITAGLLVLFFICLWFYWGSVERTPLQSQDNMTFEKARVVEVIDTENSTESSAEDTNTEGSNNSATVGVAGNQDVTVEITSGEYKGRQVDASNLNGYLYGANCKKGTKVIVQLSAYEDTLTASVYGYDRGIQLYVLIGLFVFMLCVVGGRKGINSAIALLFTFICLIFLYLPMLYQGANPFVATIFTVTIITVVSLLLIGGYSKKTLCALIGTIAGVAVSGCVAMIFGKWAHISGYNTEDIENMVFVAQNSKLQVGDLLYAGILIASLGAVMDVAMSISSTIEEIHRQKPELTSKELFKSGIHVGKDMMGTMSNTLILAFAGSSLNTMILIYAYIYPYNQIINMYSIGIEILRGVSGTIGIIMAVPFVSLIASVLMKKQK